MIVIIVALYFAYCTNENITEISTIMFSKIRDCEKYYCYSYEPFISAFSEEEIIQIEIKTGRNIDESLSIVSAF